MSWQYILLFIVNYTIVSYCMVYFQNWLKKKDGKKAEYNCSKCKAFDCVGKKCFKEREKGL